jgi:uncharacterized protein YcbK (DUF882 family)
MKPLFSEFFTRSEFSCRCNCGFNTVDTQLLSVLEEVRANFRSPITITSGCRCAKHNAKIKGSKNSQHLFGRAADFSVRNVSPIEVYNFIDDKYPSSLGLGLYSTWVHLDSRDVMARWGF